MNPHFNVKHWIGPEFVCDLASPECPMRSRLADFAGRTIRLGITFVPKAALAR